MPPEEWQFVRFGDAMSVKHGFAFKGEFFNNDGFGDVLVTPGNFAVGGGFKQAKPKFYAGPEEPAYVLGSDEIIITMTDLSRAGDTLGYPARVPADGRRYLHNQRIGKVICRDRKLLDERFLFWRLRTPDYRHHVLRAATGSTVRHTAPSRIESFGAVVAPIAEQRRIADVLDALDTKIEANRQMNETLDGIARALFKSWFIDFDPVRAKAEGRPTGLVSEIETLFPASLGDEDVPLGWQLGIVSDVLDLSRKTVDPASMDALPVAHFSIPAFDLDRMAKVERASDIASIKAAVPLNSVLFSKLNPETPRVWPVLHDEGAPMIASTEFLPLRPKGRFGIAYAWRLLASEPFRERAAACVTGTSKSHQRVQPASMMAQSALIPSEVVVQKFEEIVGPMLSRIEVGKRQSRTLASLRDLLLPKLMSGEVRVKDAEAMLEAVQ